MLELPLQFTGDFEIPYYVFWPEHLDVPIIYKSKPEGADVPTVELRLHADDDMLRELQVNQICQPLLRTSASDYMLRVLARICQVSRAGCSSIENQHIHLMMVW